MAIFNITLIYQIRVKYVILLNGWWYLILESPNVTPTSYQHTIQTSDKQIISYVKDKRKCRFLEILVIFGFIDWPFSNFKQSWGIVTVVLFEMVGIKTFVQVMQIYLGMWNNLKSFIRQEILFFCHLIWIWILVKFGTLYVRVIIVFISFESFRQGKVHQGVILKTGTFWKYLLLSSKRRKMSTAKCNS